MDSYETSIHTLEARDNVLLEVLRSFYALTDSELREQILLALASTKEALARKGIDYGALKSALVPSADRHEAGFVFNRKVVDSCAYGSEAARALLPLLDSRTTQSALSGDLLGVVEHSHVESSLRETFVQVRPVIFSDAPYCIYLNNLTGDALTKLHAGLSKFPAYAGYISATHASLAKTYLSTTLPNAFLKHKTIVLMRHEDDRPDEEDVNMEGYPFEDFGYHVRSVPSMYFDMFLSYKIERAAYPGFEADTEMAQRAISGVAVPLSNCHVYIEEAKLVYLRTHKAGSLHRASLDTLDRSALMALIEAKVAANYLYNLRYTEHDVALFNVMIEVPGNNEYPVRLVAALEYRPDEEYLRLVTLF